MNPFLKFAPEETSCRHTVCAAGGGVPVDREPREWTEDWLISQVNFMGGVSQKGGTVLLLAASVVRNSWVSPREWIAETGVF